MPPFLMKTHSLPAVMLSGFLTLLFSAMPPAHADDEIERTWTRSDDRTVVATLVSIDDGKVALQLAGGRVFTIPVHQLSLDDQLFISEWEESQNHTTTENRRAPSGHRISVWTKTDDEPKSGTRSMLLQIEINGDQKLTFNIPNRNFGRGSDAAFTDMPLAIAPTEIEKISLNVLEGDDAWRPSSVTFQFRSGDKQSKKMPFRVERWLSTDESEGDQHRTFLFSGSNGRIELSEDIPPPAGNTSSHENGSGDATVIKPGKIENPTPGSNPEFGANSYTVEANQSRGTLELTFEHPAFNSSLTRVRSMELILKVADTPNAATDSTISITSGSSKQSIAFKNGARVNETLSFPIDPELLQGTTSLRLKVHCGNNAVQFQKGDNGPALKMVIE